MCPDPQILSVYFDNELPSPWKEKMEQHLSVCPECRDRLAGYGILSQIFRPSETENSINSCNLNEVKERVWARLKTTDEEWPSRYSYTRRRHYFSIPLPVAVAAMLLVAFISIFVSAQLLKPTQRDDTIAIGPDLQGIIPVSDMGDVFKYLEQQETAGDLVIIRLPESRNFKSSGEPVLIRAADYSRRNTSR